MWPMRVGLWDCLKAAFSARPWGMLLPPNWIGLAAFGMLGFLNPGFWALGAGLEVAYLATLVSNPRFQRTVQATHRRSSQGQARAKIEAAFAELAEPERKRYRDLERQCQGILEQDGSAGGSPGIPGAGEALGRLLWVYLRLLLSRQSLRKTVVELLRSEDGAAVPARRRGASGDEGIELLEGRLRELEQKIGVPSTSEDVRKSLAGQAEILRQRVSNRRDGLQKLAFLDAELSRIEEQVKLVREQAAMAADPDAVSSRIDQISAGLGGTAQWVREQQKIYGLVDLLEEPPPLAAPPRREGQTQ